MQIRISSGGDVHCIYDELLDLRTLGQVHIERASNVEPTSEGQWIADLEPVSGPRLGPFERRSGALEAEREWLEKNRL